MHGTYQQGLLTLRKLKVGGHQRISVQHVHVNDGGQAIRFGFLALTSNTLWQHDGRIVRRLDRVQQPGNEYQRDEHPNDNIQFQVNALPDGSFKDMNRLVTLVSGLEYLGKCSQV